MLTLGIDIGTTSVCAVIYDSDNSRILKSVNQNNDTLLPSDPDCYVQDAERMERLIFQIIEKVWDTYSPEAIGITGQMHGIVYTDAGGRAVSPLITWKDKRADRLLKPALSYAGQLAKKTGYPFFAGYGLASHFYLGKNGQLPEGAAYLMTIADYVAWRLSGNGEVKIDPSMAASLGGFCLKRGGFDVDALQRAGVDTSFLPPVLTKEELGEKRRLGFYKGVPVYAAIGDNQASFLAAAKQPEEGICVNVGTGSQVSVFHKTLDLTACTDIRPYFGQGYLYVGASLNGGKAYALLGEFYKEICRQFAAAEPEPFAVMNRISVQCEDTKGLKFSPLFYGARGSEDIFGTIKGLTASNFHVPELTRALIRGMAEELYSMYLSFPEKIRQGKRRIYAGGNGMRKNDVLRWEVEQVFGLPVELGVFEEEAAVGAAISAARII